MSNPTEPDARDASVAPELPAGRGDGSISAPTVRPAMAARIVALMASADDDDGAGELIVEHEPGGFDAVTVAVDRDAVSTPIDPGPKIGRAHV